MTATASSRAARVLAIVFLANALGAAPALPPPPTTISAGDVVAHLARTISWYRHVDGLLDATALNSDALLHQSTHAAAVKALQLAFDFARTESTLLATSPQPAGETSASGSRNLDQAAQRATERVTGIQARISELDAARSSAPASARPRMAAQRSELEAQLRLALEVQKTLRSVTSFAGSSGGGLAGQLAAQISQLEALVPEARHDQATASSSPAPVQKSRDTSVLYQPESAGLLSLVTEFITLSGSDTKTAAVIAETDRLLTQTERLRNPLTTEIRNSISRSEELTNDSPSDTVQQLNADQHEIELLTSRFKQLSAALVPLREQQMMMSTTRTNLNEMHGTAARLRGDTTRYLLLRSATLGAAILLLLAISAVWR
ncbi:MAG: hypothetical protein ABUS51_03640, partial [Acidobacteriota bacterium]